MLPLLWVTLALGGGFIRDILLRVCVLSSLCIVWMCVCVFIPFCCLCSACNIIWCHQALSGHVSLIPGVPKPKAGSPQSAPPASCSANRSQPVAAQKSDSASPSLSGLSLAIALVLHSCLSSYLHLSIISECISLSPQRGICSLPLSLLWAQHTEKGHVNSVAYLPQKGFANKLG